MNIGTYYNYCNDRIIIITIIENLKIFEYLKIIARIE